MVKIKPQVIRVVLDTNVLVSALLFGGKPNQLIARWKSGDIAPVAATKTFLIWVASVKFRSSVFETS